jgi:uncharacterized protein (TIGR02284 family)
MVALNDDALGWLQQLIETNLDSRKGFAEAADNLDGNTQLKTLFCRIADERSAQASQLQALVAANGEEPEKHSSLTGAAHRAWMDLRKALGGTNKCVLEEAERGEDYILHQYEDAVHGLAGSPVIDTVQKQYVAVKASHDFVKAMRDREP